MSANQDTSDQIKPEDKFHLPEMNLPEKLSVYLMARRLNVLQVQ